jgi:hypothetical protein
MQADGGTPCLPWQVIVAPLVRLTNVKGAKIEDIGTPEGILTSLGAPARVGSGASSSPGPAAPVSTESPAQLLAGGSWRACLAGACSVQHRRGTPASCWVQSQG